MTAVSSPAWLHSTALDRRRVWAAFMGLTLIVGLGSVDQRAIFMPWADAEHPLVDTTPSAFFAQATRGDRGGGGGPRVGLANVLAAPRRFAPVAGASPAGGAAFTPVGLNGTELPGLDQVAFLDPGFTGLPGGGGGGGANSGPGLPDAGTASAPIAALSVPEASTWAMMIIGFGVIGAAMRRARRSRLERGGVSPA